VANYTASEMAVLRRSAAQWKGSVLPKSIGARLRLALKELRVIRDDSGKVAGFGDEMFVVTPKGWGLYGWNEVRQRKAHINS
jgi:hypothetical protein